MRRLRQPNEFDRNVAPQHEDALFADEAGDPHAITIVAAPCLSSAHPSPLAASRVNGSDSPHRRQAMTTTAFESGLSSPALTDPCCLFNPGLFLLRFVIVRRLIVQFQPRIII
jgi:hypothetical protein